MVYRDSESDADRRGAQMSSRGKGEAGFQYQMPPHQAKWLPAYSGGAGATNGGMGRTAMEWDSDLGSAGDEVGNDYDNDFDNPVFPQPS